MTAFLIFMGLMALLGVVTALGILYGEKKEAVKTAEKAASDAQKITKIYSRPFVDSPFGRMRGKK